MAIAALPQIDELEEREVPWSRPALRLVRDPWPELDLEEQSAPFAPRQGRDVAERRQLRLERRTRRRRVSVAVALGMTALLLVLPLRALGTVTVSGQQTPGGTPAGLMDGFTYVVQPGDSLASIAHRINSSGDQAAMIAAMAKEVGSTVVVPGEHLVLP
jgi:hypothetical protein